MFRAPLSRVPNASPEKTRKRSISGFREERAAMGNQAALHTQSDLADDLVASLLPSLQIVPIPAAAASLTPRLGMPGDDVDITPGGGDPATGKVPSADGGPAQAGKGAVPSSASEGCDKPRGIEKVISGSFKGGLTPTDYYPYLASRKYPPTAGPFDLGDRAGSSAQFLGVIASPCEPSRFTIAQTATVTRLRVNGVTNSLEGQSFDDLKRSGQDITKPPFRQEFLGGGDAPLGYIISRCDVPSLPYSPSTKSGEFDAKFISGLVGPGGSSTINWAISVRITDGKITRNDVT